jgi:hypothetical protein
MQRVPGWRSHSLRLLLTTVHGLRITLHDYGERTMNATKSAKSQKLPGAAALKRRDMEEVYARESERFVRCICGHLKYDGYCCGTCGEDLGLQHSECPDPL